MNKVNQYLLDQGFKSECSGMTCWKKAIDFVMNNPLAADKMMKIYAEVARQTGKTQSSVERAMRHSLETSAYEGPASRFLTRAILEFED